MNLLRVSNSGMVRRCSGERNFTPTVRSFSLKSPTVSFSLKSSASCYRVAFTPLKCSSSTPLKCSAFSRSSSSDIRALPSDDKDGAGEDVIPERFELLMTCFYQIQLKFGVRLVILKDLESTLLETIVSMGAKGESKFIICKELLEKMAEEGELFRNVCEKSAANLEIVARSIKLHEFGVLPESVKARMEKTLQSAEFNLKFCTEHLGNALNALMEWQNAIELQKSVLEMIFAEGNANIGKDDSSLIEVIRNLIEVELCPEIAVKYGELCYAAMEKIGDRIIDIEAIALDAKGKEKDNEGGGDINN